MRVLGEDSEIAVVNPGVFGGQTVAGYDSLNLFVETVALKTVLKRNTLKVIAKRVITRRFLMQSPDLLFRACVDQLVEPRLLLLLRQL